VTPFSMSTSSALPRSEVREWAMTTLARDLGYARYALESQSKDEVTFTRTTRSAPVWLLTIVTFPLGLVAFFGFRQVSNVMVLLSPASGGGTDIVVSGQASLRVIEGMQHRLSEDFEPEHFRQST
jgi:hypothetical protein